jgi:SAM-dependent methyltransferase
MYNDGLLSGFLRKKRLQEVLKYLKGGNILDLGCGDGELRDYLKDDVEYVGIDNIKKVLSEAINNNHPNTKFYYGDIESKDIMNRLDNNKFDNIVLSAVIEHFDNAEAVLNKLFFLLKNDGRLILTTPAPSSRIILNIGEKVRIFNYNPDDVHKEYFSKEKLFRYAEKCGYKIIQYRRFLLLNQVIVLSKG